MGETLSFTSTMGDLCPVGSVTMVPHYDLIGEFDVSLDSKGRFRMPSNLLKKLGDTEKLSFVVRKGWDPHLTLYPKPVWDALVAELNQRSELDPRVKRYAQAFWNGANEMSLDSADRIQLPKRLQGYAAGDKSLVLSARNDKIEIWTETEYQRAMEVSAAEMQALGAELFGGSPGVLGNQSA